MGLLADILSVSYTGLENACLKLGHQQPRQLI